MLRLHYSTTHTLRTNRHRDYVDALGLKECWRHISLAFYNTIVTSLVNISVFTSWSHVLTSLTIHAIILRDIVTEFVLQTSMLATLQNSMWSYSLCIVLSVFIKPTRMLCWLHTPTTLDLLILMVWPSQFLYRNKFLSVYGRFIRIRAELARCHSVARAGCQCFQFPRSPRLLCLCK